MDRETCMEHFGVPDLSKVTVNIVMKTKKQVDRRDEDYTCGYRVVEMRSGNSYCRALEKHSVIETFSGATRCIDVPLKECPFKPHSLKTGKELKPRYIE